MLKALEKKVDEQAGISAEGWKLRKNRKPARKRPCPRLAGASAPSSGQEKRAESRKAAMQPSTLYPSPAQLCTVARRGLWEPRAAVGGAPAVPVRRGRKDNVGPTSPLLHLPHREHSPPRTAGKPQITSSAHHCMSGFPVRSERVTSMNTHLGSVTWGAGIRTM